MRVVRILIAVTIVAVSGASAIAEPIPVVAQVDFGPTHFPAGWTGGGAAWNVMKRTGEGGGGRQPPTVLTDPTGAVTPITLSMPSPFGYTWNNGPNTTLTAANGVVFPGSVINAEAGGSALAVIRLATNEPLPYDYELTFASYQSGQANLHVNIGGTWDAGSFVGGQTLVLNTSSGDTGTLFGTSAWDSAAGANILDIQFYGGGSNTVLNGMVISAVPVPEPGTLLLASGLVGLLLVRRRRRKE